MQYNRKDNAKESDPVEYTDEQWKLMEQIASRMYGHRAHMQLPREWFINSAFMGLADAARTWDASKAKAGKWKCFFAQRITGAILDQLRALTPHFRSAKNGSHVLPWYKSNQTWNVTDDNHHIPGETPDRTPVTFDPPPSDPDFWKVILKPVSPKERRAAQLVYRDGKTHAQAARKMKITETYLSQLVYEVRRKLRESPAAKRLNETK
jgi:DNA-directed RNA polymerase specialized sigma subunit